MFQEFLAKSNLLAWPMVAFGIFFMTFLAVVVYALLGVRNKRGRFDHVAALPLEDDESVNVAGRSQTERGRDE